MLVGKQPDGPRYQRGQKFTLSPAGAAADEGYRSAVLAARGAGRAALEASCAAWAAPLSVAAGDGVVLGQLREKPLGLADLAGLLEDTGIGLQEVRSAVGRLVLAELVLLVPLASKVKPEPPPPPPLRWR
jgi:hypothetical protein